MWSANIIVDLGASDGKRIDPKRWYLRCRVSASPVTKTQTKLGILGGQIQLYSSQKSGKLPSQSLGLQALKGAGLVKTEEEITDAWGNPLIYTVPAKRGGDKYDLWSKGPDGIENTQDDVGNWAPPE